MAQAMQDRSTIGVRWEEPDLRDGPPLEGYAPGEDLGDVDALNPVGLVDIDVLSEPHPDPYTISVRLQVSPSVDECLQRVARFNAEIIGLPLRESAGVLSGDRLEFRRRHLLEEVDEFETASSQGDVDAAADGLLDLVYVALGALYEMGVNYGPAFDRVHAANMRRVRGEKSTRRGSLGYDAVKPEGWTGPDNSWIMRANPETVELGEIARERGIDAETLRSISDVFLHVAGIRAGKGRDYNTSVELTDYFPWGHKSYHQVQHMKTLRAKSLIELIDRGMAANYEGLLDTLYDNLNYTCFWAEAIRDGRLPLAASRGATESGATQTT